MKQHSLYVFFVGLLMGIADLVPGVSGGTVAFLCGIYDSFLQSLKTFPLGLKKTWPFLLPLGLGIGASLLLFAPTVHHLLSSGGGKCILYSAFAGFVLGNLIILQRQNPPKLFLWAALGVLLTGASSSLLIFSERAVDHAQASGAMAIVVVGAIASSVMMLPGISGSYALLFFGYYSWVIQLLARVSGMLKTGIWDGEAVLKLAEMGLGILLGFMLFSRIVEWLLRRAPQATLSFLSGCVAGGMGALWPFWEGRGLSSPRIPSMMEGQLWGALLVFFLAAFLAQWLDGLFQKRGKQDSSPSAV